MRSSGAYLRLLHNCLLANSVRACLLVFYVLMSANAMATASPGTVGWGNLFVPGLGATFRGKPLRGLVEAAAEIGLFYGGTYGVREGAFFIDSTIILPQRGHLDRPLVGQIMQQFALKLHMYNTFYNYQQASLALQNTEVEKRYQQPLYKGSWSDVLIAPFRWKNLSNPYVYSVLGAALVYLTASYHFSDVKRESYVPTGMEDALFGVNSAVVVPFGSAFGEEVLFRGMMQREFHLYTGSLATAILLQTACFTVLHPTHQYLQASVGGIYLGYLVHHFDGDLEPAIAIHFWLNVMSGVLDYFVFRAAHGRSAPWPPRLQFALEIPF